MQFEQNPYAPPTSDFRLSPRDRARIDLRIALAVLLIPALYNYYCFDEAVIAPNLNFAASSVSLWLFRVANLVGILATVALAWYLALPLLEIATWLLYKILGKHCGIAQWNDELYAVLRSVVPCAAVGAIIWFAWTVGYYVFHFDYLSISIPVAVSAHMLAAAIYLRLVIRWYQLERII